MTFGLVHASHSLPEGQAAKLTFFAPCIFPRDFQSEGYKTAETKGVYSKDEFSFTLAEATTNFKQIIV